MNYKTPSAIAAALALASQYGMAQFDISTFDATTKGPWTALNATTLVVPKVANGSITLDGNVASGEYGGFSGVTVTPGENAWILFNFPSDKAWSNAADSSFTFYLAHDDDYLYVGVDVKDDTVNSDEPNGQFWNDDAIEIVVDALNDRFDNNTDSSKDTYGGHNYVNYQGRFSGWDEANKVPATTTWATALTNWKYGATDEVFGSGKTVTGGWRMETRFKKTMMQNPDKGNKLANGYIMGFNIGLDDDDKNGPTRDGHAGNGSRSQDLEVQYFWANRARYKGYDQAYLDGLSAEDRGLQVWRTDPERAAPTPEDDPAFYANGRLSHGGTGEIVFGYDDAKKSSGKILYLCANADLSATDDAGVVALLRARGYTVTPMTSGVPDDMRAAALENDIVLISESLGSTSVLDPAGDDGRSQFALRNIDKPVISWEAFMWDNAEFTAHPEDYSNEFSFFGNTGRTESSQPAELTDLRDSIFIKKPGHAMAAGLTGKVKVYNTPYSINYGKPSAEATVIASAQENGDFPCLWVYEKGAKLVDGSVCPNKRICFFSGQVAALVANWNPEIRWRSDEGKNLLFAAIDYGIGKTTVPKSLSIARSGADITITYAGGTLQSSSKVNGPYAPEAGASPLKVTNPAGTKFYKVQ